ncbi:MAG TPA: M48 family metallopeptidase [Methylomirabilota bacterium]|nr:M48 family metallopeptidase [Methylomirabilota bacterium]
MQLDWPASYLDGKTPVRRPASVRITRTGLEVTLTDKGTRVFWPFREIRQTQGTYKGEQVRLERGGELSEALLLGDIGFLSAARATAPDAAHFHNPATRRFRFELTFVALLGAVALALGMYFIGIPALARVAASRVPVAWEERLGAAIVDHFAPADGRCEDPARQAKIDAIVAMLAARARPQPYTFRITVLNDGVVNAVAAPGGHIIVFRGLLERTDSAEELAGVLAHEIEHVLHRHVTRAIFQQASTTMLLTAVVGDVSGALAYGLEGARALGDLQMSRAAETEADREGMRLLQEAGIGTEGMITFFEKMSSRERGSPDTLTRYLRTHPTTGERIASLRALAASVPKPERRLLADDDWTDVKRLCGAAPAPARRRQ